MRIGSSIGLIAIGLILALAVNLDVSGVDLTLVGWILAAVGVVGLIVSVATARRRPVVTPPVQQPRPTENDPRY
jgi:Na+/melibiose symporter-like transporter